MLGPQHSTFVMYDKEFKRISVVIDKLLREANAKVIFLVDKNGQLIAGCGETEHLDTTSLASLTAGNIAATGGLAKLIGEKESEAPGRSTRRRTAKTCGSSSSTWIRTTGGGSTGTAT